MADKETAIQPRWLQLFGVIVGIIVSIATVLIGWKTYELNEKAGVSNNRLKEIEQRLAENRFGFERLKDIYDRTERYLNSEQDERRGRALIVLINSLPAERFREDLLAIVTVEAKKETVRVAAAESAVGNDFPKVQNKLNFFGDVVLEQLNDGRSVRTKTNFGFTDSKGYKWEVPSGTELNGAGIPNALWSVVGSPFSGKYRKAAIIHEHAINIRERPYQDVHRMFYEAMIASEVDEPTAKTLYAAVLNFGPRWSETKSD